MKKDGVWPPLPTVDAIRLFHEGAVVLSEMSNSGVRVDVDYIRRTSRKIAKQVKGIEADIEKSEVGQRWRSRYGHRANFGSRDQLAKVLFDDMKLEVQGTTAKGGRASTGKAALEKLDLPILKEFIKAEGLKKTVNTFLAAPLKEAVQQADGFWYVYPLYKLNSTASFRSSSQSPGWHQVPKRDEDMARFVRKCYLPHPGDFMVDGDFETHEVRISACVNRDPTLVKYLEDPKSDMHRDTASEMFFLTPEDWEADKAAGGILKRTVRHSAKNQFVFAQFFGSVYFQCAKPVWESMVRGDWKLPSGERVIDRLRKKGIKSLGETDPEVIRLEGTKPGTFVHHLKEVERRMWQDRFPVYDQWKKDFFAEYQRTGFYRTVTGFVIHTHHARNEVVNTPIQGPAFHCLLWSLVVMQKKLRRYKMKSKLVGQIHDSSQGSVRPKERDAYCSMLYETMVEELPRAWPWITVRLGAEFEGTVEPDRSWGEQVKYVESNGHWGPAA